MIDVYNTDGDGNSSRVRRVEQRERGGKNTRFFPTKRLKYEEIKREQQEYLTDYDGGDEKYSVVVM